MLEATEFWGCPASMHASIFLGRVGTGSGLGTSLGRVGTGAGVRTSSCRAEPGSGVGTSLGKVGAGAGLGTSVGVNAGEAASWSAGRREGVPGTVVACEEAASPFEAPAFSCFSFRRRALCSCKEQYIEKTTPTHIALLLNA